jgi:hypothetical protein
MIPTNALGEGDLSGQVLPDGTRYILSYSDGQVLQGDGFSPLRHALVKANEPYRLRRAAPPVAVLTGPGTNWTFEAAVIAFRGRPKARTFGEPTSGHPIGFKPKQLPDGAQMDVTTSFTADRTGRVYSGPNVPDQLVAGAATSLPVEQDPVVRAAVEWLRGQGCAAP